MCLCSDKNLVCLDKEAKIIFYKGELMKELPEGGYFKYNVLILIVFLAIIDV